VTHGPCSSLSEGISTHLFGFNNHCFQFENNVTTKYIYVSTFCDQENY
jgi:hypothetical protein